MIKKFLMVGLVVVVAWVVIKLGGEPVKKSLSPTPSPTVAFKKIKYREVEYGYEWVEEAPEAIKLVANFGKRLDSARLVEENDCRSAINGGFYDENDEPLGLVVNEGQEIAYKRKSSLFNGFFWVDKSNQVRVGYEILQQEMRIAVQSGPMVRENGGVVDLRLKDDKQARRMVVGVRKSGGVIFMTIFDPQTLRLGPLLDDLPEIVDEIDKKEGLEMGEVINMDGGRASAFYGRGLVLPEATWVGSLLCALERN